MTFEIREILLQAQLVDQSQDPDHPTAGDHLPDPDRLSTAIQTEIRRMIKEELDRRARR